MDELEEISDLRREIERFIEQYDGTIIGYEVKNRYENSDGSMESLKDIYFYTE